MAEPAHIVLEADDASRSWVELPGLEALLLGAAPRPGQPFRRSDPGEEAHAHARPSGLIEEVAEDAEGIEEEHPFAAVAAEHPVTAIDAGVARLGWTADGTICAVRAAAVTHRPDRHVELRTYRPGILIINRSNRLPMFHAMGKALGREDFYVEVRNGQPRREKVELGPHDHRLADRVRNFVERLVQRAICNELVDGAILIDGALTLRTYDTPGIFLRNLHETCQERDLSLVAVAKKTGLTIRGVDIRLLLDRYDGLPGRRKLTRALKLEAAKAKKHQGELPHRALGDLYVTRFAPGGDVYRVDVDPAPGLTSARALDEIVASCLFRAGYPEPLIEAHVHSYFTPPYVAELQAHAIAGYEFIPMSEPNLGPVFAPFGGRYK